jgi:ABC-type antimicrobial peptide transport system permease subunit
MSWRDALTMATREVRRRPGRALLTVLAIALASALLSSLLTIAGTAKTRVLTELSRGGSLAGILVEPNFPNASQATLDDPSPGPPETITPVAVARIARLKDVLTVLPVVATTVVVVPPATPPAGSTLCPTSRGGSAKRSCDEAGTTDHGEGAGGIEAPIFSAAVLGADLARVDRLPITVLAGRLPVAGSATEVVVSEAYLQELGITSARASEVVGTRIELVNFAPSLGEAALTRFVTVEVVGVVDQQITSGDVVAWPNLVDAIFSSEDPPAPGINGPPIQGAIVIAKQLGDVSSVRSSIAGIGYSTTAPVGLIISVSRYLHVVQLVLSGIGIVALAIAALGIANALMAAVRERRREIGVLKAIGARDRDVLRVFLFEASTLGVLGGMLGTLLGIIMAGAIVVNANAYLHAQGLAGVSLSVPWSLPVASIVGSAVVALVAGTIPALRAAHLPAREAVDA